MRLRKFILIVISIAIMALCICSKNTYASSSNIVVSNTTAKVGDTITVTIKGNAASWNVDLNSSGPVKTTGITRFSNTTDDGENKDVTIGTVTYTVIGEGNIKFNLSGQLVDSDYTKKDATGTASVKAIANNTNTGNNTANNTGNNAGNNAGNNTGNNAGNNNTANNNTTETPKPKEPTFKDVNETVYVTDTVNVRSTYSSSGGKYGTLQKGDSVTRTGICTETIGGYVWSRISYNGKTAYVISSRLTTVKPEEEEKDEEEKSSNKSLKSLEVENYTLTPEFDPETRSYSIELTNEEDKLEINAVPEDEKATVNITGNEDLKVGNNIVKITVTAEDGTTRMYSITVSKTNEEGVTDSLKLSSLQVSNATLNPSFSPEITSYEITVQDPSTIKKENVTAVSEDTDVTITVAENEASENGEKIITIMLESKDGSKTGVYQISVKKPVINQTPIVENNNNNNNSIYYILGGIIGVLLILIILIVVVLRKTSDKDEDYDDEDDEDYDDKDTDEFDNNYYEKNADDINDNVYDSGFDGILKGESVKSQILNSKLNLPDEVEVANEENTRIMNKLDYNLEEDDNDIPNISPNKKGKHF